MRTAQQIVRACRGARNRVLILLLLALWLAAWLAWREWGIEPREWGALCAAANPPWPCAPRAALAWAQGEYAFGAAALALALAGFLLRSQVLALPGLALGLAALVNYNATWGMVAVALGLWTWLVQPRRGATR